jgi:hypothetical protein
MTDRSSTLLAIPDTVLIGCPIPKWNAETRELWWHGHLIKRFRVPALSQEMILAAFEEDGWLRRIDDPLPRLLESDTSDRLREAVRGLTAGKDIDFCASNETAPAPASFGTFQPKCA